MSGQVSREITGRTRVLFILAQPVSHVRTPQAINALALERGADCVMVPCEVSSEDLGTVLSAIRRMRSVDGAVVTAPHKIAAAAFCDQLSDQASRVGAVNVIRRTQEGALLGEIFDGRGFVAGLAASHIAVAGERIFMAGAGGAARAIGFALAEAGAQRLVIFNRTVAKAEQLVADIRAQFPRTHAILGDAEPGDASLVINASSLGMQVSDPPPFNLNGLKQEMTVADVIMQPATTALLMEAQRRGCRIQPGKAMLEQQLLLVADFLAVR
jgi:shikimate dehydrogenase